MQSAESRSPGAMGVRPGQGAMARKVRLVLTANLLVFTMAGLLTEVGFRLFWHPRDWVYCESWLVGSGAGRAGPKWWPNTTYRIEGREFSVRFRSDAQGYRARPAPPRTADPFRIAFVGDSYTEAKQVEYDQSFVDLLEHGLAGQAGRREVVGLNYGIAGSGFFDYWHRITHDVFRPGVAPPIGIVLCIFPGNDFWDFCPEDGFDPDGQPVREYFDQPTWPRHVITWLNLKLKCASFVVQSLKRRGIGSRPLQLNAPAYWWSDPAVARAAQAAPAIRQVRALMHAIEQECDRHGTRLVILVVGPVNTYAAKEGKSPVREIFTAWGIKAPVIDVAAQAMATERPSRLVFSLDGHLNPAGHRFCAETALEPLSQALGLPAATTALRDHDRSPGETR